MTGAADPSILRALLHADNFGRSASHEPPARPRDGPGPLCSALSPLHAALLVRALDAHAMLRCSPRPGASRGNKAGRPPGRVHCAYVRLRFAVATSRVHAATFAIARYAGAPVGTDGCTGANSTVLRGENGWARGKTQKEETDRCGAGGARGVTRVTTSRARAATLSPHASPETEKIN